MIVCDGVGSNSCFIVVEKAIELKMEIPLRVPNLSYVLQGEDTVNFKVNTTTIATNVDGADAIVVDVVLVVDDVATVDVGTASACVGASATTYVADFGVDVAASYAMLMLLLVLLLTLMMLMMLRSLRHNGDIKKLIYLHRSTSIVKCIYVATKF